MKSEVAKSSSDPSYGPQLSPQLRRPRRSEGLSCFATCSLVFLHRASMELTFLTAQVSRAFHWSGPASGLGLRRSCTRVTSENP